MKISSVGANQTEVALANGNVVLVSYQTPIAIAFTNNQCGFASCASWYWDSEALANKPLSKTSKTHLKLFFARHGIRRIMSDQILTSDLQSAIDNDNK